MTDHREKINKTIKQGRPIPQYAILYTFSQCGEYYDDGKFTPVKFLARGLRRRK